MLHVITWSGLWIEIGLASCCSPECWFYFFSLLWAELPGWPLLTPLKVQMQKCDKCSREFCSTINYRRHIRVHHRLKKLDKVSLLLCKCNYMFISRVNFSHATQFIDIYHIYLLFIESHHSTPQIVVKWNINIYSYEVSEMTNTLLKYEKMTNTS